MKKFKDVFNKLKEICEYLHNKSLLILGANIDVLSGTVSVVVRGDIYDKCHRKKDTSVQLFNGNTHIAVKIDRIDDIIECIYDVKVDQIDNFIYCNIASEKAIEICDNLTNFGYNARWDINNSNVFIYADIPSDICSAIDGFGIHAEYDERTIIRCDNMDELDKMILIASIIHPAND